MDPDVEKSALIEQFEQRTPGILTRIRTWMFPPPQAVEVEIAPLQRPTLANENTDKELSRNVLFEFSFYHCGEWRLQHGQQATWVTKDTRLPCMIQKMEGFTYRGISTRSVYVQTLPDSFQGLVRLAFVVGEAPVPASIPEIYHFPELRGYWWENRQPPEMASRNDRGADIYFPSDEQQLHNIILSSINTNGPPLCSPDFFLMTEKSKMKLLERMFANRNEIPEIKWDLSSSDLSEPHQHPDWDQFIQYVKTTVPTGEFLEEPSTWNSDWFARIMVETNMYRSVPVRQDIAKLTEQQGFRLSIPSKAFSDSQPLARGGERYWLGLDRQAIYRAAEIYWKEWRTRAEKRLKANDLASDLIELGSESRNSQAGAKSQCIYAI